MIDFKARKESEISPEICNIHFVETVKKRGRIRRVLDWIAFGAVAIGVLATWSYDGQAIKKEISYIEKPLGEKFVNNDAYIRKHLYPISGVVTIWFAKLGVQTWTVPSDWNTGSNTISAISGGGAGGTMAVFCGGGGGGYAAVTNFSLTPGQTCYICVGVGGNGWGANGQDSWFNAAGNFVPGSVSQGCRATGALGGGTTVPLGYGGCSSHTPGAVGTIIYAGGNGLSWGGGSGWSNGGGAAGPHGPGVNATINGGGAGDAGYGGAGGISTFPYSPVNNGQPGPNNGSGGGGADCHTPGPTGNGGAYGGGGATNYVWGVGCQGIVTITYTPYVPPVVVPTLPAPNATPNTPAPNCVPSGIDTATKAQIYWAYGSWSDPWNNVSSAHYDTNYKRLIALASDTDAVTYDIQYNTTLPWNFQNEAENFFNDYPRIWKSRSNEWVDDGGTKSVWMRHRTIIGNADCVPDIDPPSGYVTVLTNQLFMDEQTYGYRLAYANNFGFFQPGDIITQQVDSAGTINVSGTVYMMDPNYIYVYNTIGGFFQGTIMNAYNPSINAYVTASVEINEKYSANVFPGQSRYICKSTVLASGQDAEDLQAFITAYRPANTNFKVYGKIISQSDPGNYADKIWSRMTENTATQAAFSSLTNQQDYVSLNYAFPASQLLFSNLESCGCASNSLFVTVPTTTQFAAGDFIYLSSPGQGTFNVRQIAQIPNNSTLSLTTYPSFSNTANLNVGIIPGLEDLTGAFLYDQNDGIVRYVTNNDVSFDFFNQFAGKIVPTSDNPVICPTFTEPRFAAAQASS